MTSSRDEALGETLRVVARMMAGARSDWWVIGSAAVWLHGVDDVIVADVDVLASEADGRTGLDRLGAVVRSDGGNDLFRSAVFGRYEGTPLPIEVMAGFAVCGPEGFVPVVPATREMVTRGDLRLPVTSRAELVALLHRFGRPKDFARAALLARHSV